MQTQVVVCSRPLRGVLLAFVALLVLVGGGRADAQTDRPQAPVSTGGGDFDYAFSRSSSGVSWIKQAMSGCSPQWGAWTSIGKPSGVTLDQGPAACQFGTRRFVVARGTDGNVYGAQSGILESDAWTWFSLGGSFTGSPTCVWTTPMDVFARGTDNELWHNRFDPALGGWIGWENLSLTLGSKPLASSPVATYGNTNAARIDVFAQAADHSMIHVSQDVVSGAWSSWESLGGVFTSDPAAGYYKNPSNVTRLYAFGRGTDNAIYQNVYTPPSGLVPGSWSGWASLGGSFTGPPSGPSKFGGRVYALNGTQVFAHSLSGVPGGWVLQFGAAP